MRLVSSALTIAALLAGTETAYGATESVSLGSAEETDPEPAPLLEPAPVDNPVSFKVTYTATPVQSLEIRAGLNCIRGSETPGRPGRTGNRDAPRIAISLTAPAGSDSCLLTAFAETPISSGVFGTVRIEGEAIRTSKSQPTPTPKTKKKCKKGKKLRHGKCVKGKQKHPHRGSSQRSFSLLK